MNRDQALVRLDRRDAPLAGALEQIKLAYQFAPGSYTFSAMSAVMNALYYTAPDWIAETSEWNNNGETM